ncbi:MAG: hypothetical protein C0402_10510 [Thermodesulfovibrio sp.]|nr:hypothetical protein [Thermodesulfovibrio sp.]
MTAKDSILQDWKQTLPLFVALIVAGIAGNYYSYELFFSIQFIFGSIFAMLALQLLGLRYGVLAAALISSITWQLWNHPYAIIIMTGEVLFAGLLTQRRKNIGIVEADAIYWVCIGMPLVYFFYYVVMHVSTSNATITMLKQAVNGIANVLTARLIFIAVPSRFKQSTYSLQELMFNIMVFFVLIASLLLLTVQSRKELAEADRSIRGSLGFALERVSGNVEKWLRSNLHMIEYLARESEKQPMARMQQIIALTVDTHRDLSRIGIMDRNAVSRAYAPPVDELGRSNIGKSFADRDYLPALKQTLRPMLSEIMTGRVGVPGPVAALLVPIVLQGEYAGYVGGILNLQGLQTLIALNAKGQMIQGLLFTLVDRHGRIIVTNREDMKVMDAFIREPGELKQLENGIVQWLPSGNNNISVSDRWKNSYYVAENRIGNLSEWRLILDMPIAPLQKKLFEKYAAYFGEVFVLILVALLLARLLSHKLVSSLQELGTVSADIPSKLLTSEEITWPKSNIVETQHLIDNFMEMSLALMHQFKEIRNLNQELEARVNERTRKLQESETRFRAQYRWLPVPTYTWKKEGDDFILIDCNAAAETISEGKISEYFGSRAGLFYQDRPDIVDDIRACHHQQEHIGRKMTYTLRSTGEVKDFSVDYVFVPPDMVMVHTEDITERNKAEEQLRRSEQLLKDVTSNLGVGVYVFDDRGKITFMNPMAEYLWGWTKEELNEKGAHAVVHYLRPDGTPLPLEECRMHGVITGKTAYISSDEVFVRRDGTIFPVSVISTPLIKEEAVIGSITAFRDITEDKRMEEEVRKAQKLESVGVLAGGIAHDFNNLLTGIMGNISLGKIFLSEGKPERVAALLNSAEEASEAAKELSFRLLTFSKGGDPIRTLSSIEGLLKRSAALALSGSNVAATFVLEPCIRPVEMDEGQMLQVFNNIILNAKEAMPQGGTITITAENATVPGGDAASLKKGLYTKISIRDTGCGIPRLNLDRIFDPYFSTKGLGSRKGTGLGLSICMSVIKKHEGHITVESREGEGTTFNIWLPLPAEDHQMSETGFAKIQPAARKILFMDDDERIRSLVCTMMEFLAYDISFAVSGEEAIEIYTNTKVSGICFDLVILDLTVPGGMGGEQTVQRLLEIDPGVKAVISSGYADSPVLQHYREYGFVDAIAKPYRIEHLKALFDKLFP